VLRFIGGRGREGERERGREGEREREREGERERGREGEGERGGTRVVCSGNHVRESESVAVRQTYWGVLGFRV
jgi:hypothetical protein